MTNSSHSEHDLKRENADLRARLEEAEDALRALRAGEVDALVVSAPGGPRVYTLAGADHAYRVIIEEMSEGAATVTPDGTVLYCNKRFAALVSLPLGEVIGRSVASHLRSPDLEAVRTLALGQDGTVHRVETSIARADGADVPVFLSAYDLSAYDLPAACLIVADLTEEKRTQRTLASAKLTNAVIEQAGEAIVVIDAEGLVIRANAAAHRLCERDATRLPFDVACPLRFAQRSAADAGDPVTAALLTREPISGSEVYLDMPDCGRSDLLLNSNPLTDEEGETIGAVITLTDVTEEVAARERIGQLAEVAQRQAAELDAVLSTIPSGLVIYGPGSQVLRVNPAAEGMLGFTAGQLSRPWEERLPLVDLRLASGEPLAKEVAPSMRALRGETVTDQLMRGRRADGAEIWLSFSAAPVRNAADEIVASVATFRDVTPLMAAQEELRRHRDQLQQLVAEAVSELQTANTQLAEEVEERAIAQEELEASQMELRRLASQLLHAEEGERRRIAAGIHDDISQALAFAKIKLQMVHQAAPPEVRAPELEELIALMTKIIGSTRDLTFDLSPPVLFELGLAPAMEWLADALNRQFGLCAEIIADETRLPLSQAAALVLFRSTRELLVNVVKHSGRTAARVEVRRDGDLAVVIVSDKGRGFRLPEGQQAEATSSFGLFSIRERMSYIGGSMDVVSAPRKGTRVTLTAPLEA